MSLQKIFPVLKDENGNSIKCQCGCRRVARHIHHIQPRCQGGSDDPNNLLFLCQKCHVAHHSKHGHFAQWGKMGGLKAAEQIVSQRNLKQFQGAEGLVRFEAYLNRKADQMMGVQ